MENKIEKKFFGTIASFALMASFLFGCDHGVVSSLSQEESPVSSSLPSSSSQEETRESSASSTAESDSRSDASSQSSSHEHSFSEKWDYDEEEHWHNATCGHDVRSDASPHDFLRDVHQPDYDNPGYTVFTCKVCSYSYIGERTEPIPHRYSTEYTYDEQAHWRVCLDAGYENVITDYSVHHFNSGVVTPATIDAEGFTTYSCTECGYSYIDNYVEYVPQDLVEYLDITLSEEKDGYVVTGIHGRPRELDIPHYYNGLPVVEISCGALQACERLEKLSIPFVGGSENDNCFLHYLFGAESPYDYDHRAPKTLKTVIVKEGTKSLGEFAFYGCKYIEHIELPNTLTEIGGQAFVFTNALVPTVYDHAFYLGNEENPYLALLSATYQLLTSCQIHDDCRLVCPQAFSDCNELVSLIIPKSVIFIGNNAFRGCTSLSFVLDIYEGVAPVYPSGAEDVTCRYHGSLLGWLGFERQILQDAVIRLYLDGDEESTEIVVPGSVTSIDENVFARCDGIRKITLPFLGKSIEEPGPLSYLFGGILDNLEEVVVSEGCLSIVDGAFADWASLRSISLPSTVSLIGQRAFMNCSSLQSLIVSCRATISGNRTFYGCTSLLSLDLSRMTAEGNANQMFFGCTSLSTLLLPSGLRYFMLSSISGCDSLPASYVSYDNGTYLPTGDNPYEVFAGPLGEDITFLTIHPDCKVIPVGSLSGCNQIKELTVPFIGCGMGYDYLGAFFGSSVSTGHASYVPMSLTKIVITGTDVKIGEFAFSNCSSLEEVHFGSGVKQICTGAFNNIKSISVYYHGDISSWLSLYGKDELPFVHLFLDGSEEETTSIVLPASIGQIGGWAFYGCKWLSSITIENGITSIGTHAFDYCNGLHSIMVPESLAFVSDNAFDMSGGAADLTFYAHPKTPIASWGPNWYPRGNPKIVWTEWY